MWKLKITRKYIYKMGDGEFERESDFEYVFPTMEEAVSMIEQTQGYAVNGTYEYHLEKEV